jgi:tRNA pseudouridine13 synthase
MCEAFARGDIRAALDACPSRADPEAAALQTLLRGDAPAKAVRAIGAGATRFFVSAFQSAVFNRVLDRRLEEDLFDCLLVGDVAWRHDTGALFSVDGETLADPEIEQRLHRLDISPSGPMWGPKMLAPGGRAADLEHRVLAETHVAPDMIERFDARLGVRRPLRAPIGSPDVEGGVDEHGGYIRVAFDLPPGAFATVVLDEIMKTREGFADGEGSDDE